MNVNFGDKNYIPNNKPLVNIRWANLTLMLMILVFAALLGAITKSNFPKLSEPVRLFENTYRMGSLVFGGGNILYSMILTEFVEFKQKQYLTIQEFSTGLGLLQAIPGPTFTIATYANGIAMKKLGYGVMGQLLGCGVGTIAVFLPGTLLIFFLYPIWNQIKQYPIVYRSLDGIIAISVGFLWSAAFIMLLSFVKQIDINHIDSLLSLVVFLITFVSLRYQKIPAIFLVVLSICLGYFVS
jgi:chromate transporter